MHAFPRLSLPVFRAIVAAELERDKVIIEKMPQQEATLDWFQLNHFDRPLVATRKLMQRHYAPARDVIPVARDRGMAAASRRPAGNGCDIRACGDGRCS